jgi:glycosyltransferase involved in cell wall biosynthesis
MQLVSRNLTSNKIQIGDNQTMNILFISHDSDRAGAQLLLLGLLKWIKTNTKHSVAVLVKKDGVLCEDLKEFGSVYLWRMDNSFISKITRKIYRLGIRKRIENFSPDLIYSNTIVNGSILNELSFLNKPVLTHIHELEYWINIAGEENMQFNIQHTNKFIAVSEAVKENLINKHNVESGKIDVINGFVDIYEEKSSLYEFLKLPKDSILIGASGGESWRKGKDLFIPLAIETLKHLETDNVHFVWVGGRMTYELKYDLEKSGYADRIHFIEHLENAKQYFGDLYLFLMTSREDSFPLVNIEAAAHGVPVLCFDSAGGTPEFINGRAGAVVPYLDLVAMSNKIWGLLEDKEKRNQLGKNAKEESGKYSVDIIAGKIIKKMQECANE